MGLFETGLATSDDWKKIGKTLDSISKKFGKNVVGRASLKGR